MWGPLHNFDEINLFYITVNPISTKNNNFNEINLLLGLYNSTSKSWQPNDWSNLIEAHYAHTELGFLIELWFQLTNP